MRKGRRRAACGLPDFVGYSITYFINKRKRKIGRGIGGGTGKKYLVKEIGKVVEIGKTQKNVDEDCR